MADDAIVQFRWIEGRECPLELWDKIDKILESRGWASLNRETSRILLAEHEGKIVGLNVFQMVPFAGPLFVVPSLRGTGLAEELADRMLEFLRGAGARTWIATAESPHAARLCESRGMKEIDMPLFAAGNPGGWEV